MYFDKIIEAIKEHCFEGIVVVLYFFYNPAKYIEIYRSWPETNIFIFFFSTFLLFSIFFKKFDFKNLKSKNYINLLLTSGFVISGILAFIGAVVLYQRFDSVGNPFFWIFVEKYIIYIITIILILALGSLAVEYIERHIE
jgi:uncharacterized membrane protein